MIFLRHPVPDAAAGLCYGRLDIGLGPDAPRQIEAALAATPRARRVIASPARRCRALAQALAARDGLTAELEPLLREYDFGDWEGKRWRDLPRADTEAWLADPWANAAPGGDSFQALHDRVARALAGIGPDTLVICHAGPIRAARMLLEGLDFDAVFARPVPYATPLDLSPEAAAWRASR